MQTGSNSHHSSHPIDMLRQLPLEPMEYCRRWVSQEPGRNYRKACIKGTPENKLSQIVGAGLPRPYELRAWQVNDWNIFLIGSP